MYTKWCEIATVYSWKDSERGDNLHLATKHPAEQIRSPSHQLITQYVLTEETSLSSNRAQPLQLAFHTFIAKYLGAKLAGAQSLIMGGGASRVKTRRGNGWRTEDASQQARTESPSSFFPISLPFQSYFYSFLPSKLLFLFVLPFLSFFPWFFYSIYIFKPLSRNFIILKLLAHSDMTNSKCRIWRWS
jgi:hypothetical protein